MTLIWWIVWAILYSCPPITSSHWLSFLILAVALDLVDAAKKATT